MCTIIILGFSCPVYCINEDLALHQELYFLIIQQIGDGNHEPLKSGNGSRWRVPSPIQHSRILPNEIASTAWRAFNTSKTKKTPHMKSLQMEGNKVYSNSRSINHRDCKYCLEDFQYKQNKENTAYEKSTDGRQQSLF